MAMNPREKGLLVATVVALIVFFAYRMGWHETAIESVRSLGDTTYLEQEMRTFQRVRDAIAREDIVEAEYARKVRQRVSAAEDEGDPKAAFVEDVAALCRDLNIQLTRIDPAQREPIPGVEDYDYITLNVNYNKSWPEVVQLLKHFDDNFYLIKELSIAAPLDKGIVKVDISLARVIPLTDEEKKERKAEQRKSRRSRR